MKNHEVLLSGFLSCHIKAAAAMNADRAAFIDHLMSLDISDEDREAIEYEATRQRRRLAGGVMGSIGGALLAQRLAQDAPRTGNFKEDAIRDALMIGGGSLFGGSLGNRAGAASVYLPGTRSMVRRRSRRNKEKAEKRLRKQRAAMDRNRTILGR